ncbi:hypothetical protein HKX48_002483 [Thoreauomyces humboldtii]|nr:hypothetical protein HKX48_002483 [Thoreauomyces humboldtii]
MAVGGDAQLTNWSLGSNLFPQPQSCPAIVAADIYPYALTAGPSSLITMQAGDISNGNIGVVYPGTNASTPGIGPTVLAKLRKRRCSVQGMDEQEFDFNATQLELEGISEKLFDLDSTVTVVLDPVRPAKTIMTLGGVQGGVHTEVVYLESDTLPLSSIVGEHR